LIEDIQMMLVTGATGSNGTEILKLLAARNVRVRVMVRDQTRAKDIATPNKVSAVDVLDIAEVAVAALTETGHERKIYDLTGSQALTHAQMAKYQSTALARQIAFVDVS
jgi:uncharacterized protein YbjT (DUF2867 family)